MGTSGFMAILFVLAYLTLVLSDLKAESVCVRARARMRVCAHMCHQHQERS